MKEVSSTEWENIPDALELVKVSRKRKNQEHQRYTPVPDSILQAASSEAAGGKTISSIDPRFAPNGMSSTLPVDLDSHLNKFLNDSTE